MNFILFFILTTVLSCTDPIIIKNPISTSYSYEKTYDLEHNGVETQWNCEQIDSKTRTNKAATFQFTVEEKQQIEVSTCHETTDFASRLIISTECNNGMITSCQDAIDGDPNGQCDGHRSRLIFEAEKGQKYLVTVMGVTSSDVGKFKLTIQPYTSPNSYSCSEAMTVSKFPTEIQAIVTSDMQYMGNAHGLKRGFWFKFTATKTTHVIDTCNKNTQYPTSIYLYYNATLSKNCMSDMPIVEAVDGCGSNARLYYDKFVVGQEYYVFVFFTNDISKNPVTGSLEITFRENGGENYECANAYTITKKPFNTEMDVRGYTPSNSPCVLSEDKIGLFYSVRGDGKRYVFHTCFTGSSGDDKTTVELIKGDCGGCIESKGSACGNDQMMTLVLEDNVLYKFRVTTTNQEKRIKIGLMQVAENDNYQCENARVMNMTLLGDQYTQYMIGSNQEAATQFNCGDGQSNMLGGWYLYKARDEDITIMHGIYSFRPQLFKGYLATLESCSKCVESSYDHFIAEDLVIPAGQTRYVFATTIRQEGVGSKYGTFMYWAVRSTNRGGSYQDAYTVTAPFTGIFAIGTHKLTIECDHSIPNLQTFPAIAIKYNQPAETTYTATTCGSETVVSTMIEIVKETSENSGIYDCFATNDYNDCGYGSTITTSGENTYYALVGINPHSSEEKSVLRFNLYEDKTEESSQCTHAEQITSLPSQVYSYTSKAHPSSSSCNIISDGLKGKWFVYTPTEDTKLSIMTDDVCTFNTQIGVYTSCTVESDESIPGECVAGATTTDTPVGQHGTHVSVDMKEGQKYYIFVGGSRNSESGIMRVKFDYYVNYDDDDNDGLSGGEIFGIVFASLLLVVFFVGISIFVGYVIYNKLHQTESQFNTF